MTQSREVLAMMDAHTTTFGRKRGCTVSPCGAFLFGAAVFISLVVTGLLVYHLAPCLEEKLVKPCGDFCNSEFEGRGLFNKDTYNKKKLDVRLPRSVVPDSYELKLIPFIQVGNFTFHGEMRRALHKFAAALQGAFPNRMCTAVHCKTGDEPFDTDMYKGSVSRTMVI